MFEFDKDAADISHISIGIAKWLKPGEAVVNLSVTSNSDDLTVDGTSISEDSGILTAVVSGGVFKQAYRLVYIYTTNTGRRKKTTVLISMEDN